MRGVRGRCRPRAAAPRHGSSRGVARVAPPVPARDTGEGSGRRRGLVIQLAGASAARLRGDDARPSPSAAAAWLRSSGSSPSPCSRCPRPAVPARASDRLAEEDPRQARQPALHVRLRGRPALDTGTRRHRCPGSGLGRRGERRRAGGTRAGDLRGHPRRVAAGEERPGPPQAGRERRGSRARRGDPRHPAPTADRRRTPGAIRESRRRGLLEDPDGRSTAELTFGAGVTFRGSDERTARPPPSPRERGPARTWRASEEPGEATGHPQLRRRAEARALIRQQPPAITRWTRSDGGSAKADFPTDESASAVPRTGSAESADSQGRTRARCCCVRCPSSARGATIARSRARVAPPISPTGTP